MLNPARALAKLWSANSLAAIRVLIAATLALQSGCWTTGSAGSHVGERFMVKTERTPFYKIGPAQTSGPDFTLSKGRPVTMLSQQFGFSHVATDDGQSGYVPTEDLIPAPPEPKPSPSAASALDANARQRSKFSSRRPSTSADAPAGLPEFPETKPPSDAPGFRY